MAKVVLNDIVSLANTQSAKQALNENFDRIEAAMDNTLSRDGTLPNQMEADIDMNSNDLLNVGVVDASSYLVNGVPLEQSVAYANKAFQLLDGTGVQTDFTLDFNPGSLGNLEVSIDGVVQRPGLDFSFTGTTLSFVVAPPVGIDNILVRYDQALPTGVTSADAILYTPPSTGIAGSIRQFLDSLWSPLETAGAALIRFIQAGLGAIPRPLLLKVREYVSVTDFGAVGNGIADDTVAVQAAVDYCVTSGKMLYVPAGKYKLTATIFVTGAIVIYGEGWSVARNTAAPGPGSWFYLAHPGKGFFLSTINSGAVFRDLGTYRDHAAPAPGWIPTVYDYDFEMNVASNEWTWENVILLNPYKGIKASNRPTFRHVRMQPFKEGISIDNCHDVARFDSVHVWPFWSEHTAVRDNMLGNLESYRFRRADNPEMVSAFSIWHKTGILIDGDGAGNTVYRLFMLNCDIETGAMAIHFTTGAHGATVHVANSVLHGADEVPLSVGVLMECNNARLQLSNTELTNFGAYAMNVSGSGNLVPMSAVHVNNWNKINAGHTAISVNAGCTITQETTTFLNGNGAAVWGGSGQMFGVTGAKTEGLVTDASGDLTITHGLRYSPAITIPTQTEPDTGYFLRAHSRNATTFKVRVKNDAGATVGAGVGLTIQWQASGLNI